MNLHLLIIDAQHSFCNPNGALFVPGADQDVIRLSNMVDRLKMKIDDIHVTLDSHNEVDIAHPIFWINNKGEHPDPFTIISVDDVVNGVWSTTNPACRKRATAYVRALDANGRYPLCIWPPHCIIGTEGCTIEQPLADRLSEWCRDRFKKINYVVKGSNIFTEHYSAIQADVIDPKDPTTMLNTGFTDILAEADQILIAGQALSHCVANTVTDIINVFGESNVSKLVLLEDACSNVPTFESFGDDFIKMATGKGMKIANTVDFLA